MRHYLIVFLICLLSLLKAPRVAAQRISATLPDTVVWLLKQTPPERHDSLCRVMGKYYYQFYNERGLDLALRCYVAALDAAKRLNHKESVTAAYFDIGSVYDAMNIPVKAAQYYQLVYDDAHRRQVPADIIRSAYNLAVTYTKSHDTARAYDYINIMQYELWHSNNNAYTTRYTLLIANLLSRLGYDNEFLETYGRLPADAHFNNEDLAYARLYAEANSDYRILTGAPGDPIAPLWEELRKTTDSIPVYTSIEERLARLGRWEEAYRSLQQLGQLNRTKVDAVARRDMQNLQLLSDIDLKEQHFQLLQVKQEELNYRQRLLVIVTVSLGIGMAVLTFLFGKIQGQNRALRRNQQELKEQRDNIQVLLKEVHHRVKNNLQVITSLIEMQRNKQTRDSVEESREIQAKMRSIALAHQMMYEQEQVDKLPLQEYLEQMVVSVLQIFGATAGNIRYEVSAMPGTVLNLDKIVPLALMVDEMLINTLKYAAPAVPECVVRINCTLNGGKLTFVYEDNGPGVTEDQANKTSGIGRRLLRSLARQLGGSLEAQSAPGFLRYIVIFKP